ncbi:MAG: hypothetical protein WCJ09_15780 [Planctomycetota bacterium]
MIIIWGSGLYGKVDKVPGVGHVATNFGHLYYIPLIPTQTHFVISESSSGYQSVPIGMSMKSILMAWFRTAMVFGILMLSVTSIIMFSDRHPADGIINAAIAVGCLGALIASYFVRMCAHASYERAMDLADAIGLNEHGRQLLDEHYGVVPRKKKARKVPKRRIESDDDEYEDY